MMWLSATTALFGQWEWAGSVSSERNYIFSGSAAGRIFLRGGLPDQLWVSTDGGESWVGSRSPNTFHHIQAAATGNDTTLFAIGDISQIWKSTNLGMDWNRCDSGTSWSHLSSLAFGSGSHSSAQGVLIAGSSSSGLFRSTDGGVHWTVQDSGLTTLAVTCLAASDSVLFAGTESRGVFRSTDYGVSWNPVDSGLSDSSVSLLAASSGLVFAACGKTLYSSSDQGSSWIRADTASLPAAIWSLALIPSPGLGNGVAVFAFTPEGLYRLMGPQQTWQQINTPTFSPQLQGIGLVASAGILCYADPFHILRSADLGESWDWIGQCIFPNGLLLGRSPMGEQRGTLYAMSSSNLYASTNRGVSWKVLFARPSTLNSFASFAIGGNGSPGSPARFTIGTGTGDGMICHSPDGGKTWTYQEFLFPAHYVNAVVDLDSILVASVCHPSGLVLPEDSVRGIYASRDAGVRWEKLDWGAVSDSGLTDLAAFQTESAGRVLFAGNYDHLYRSTNDGQSWTECTAGLGGAGRKTLGSVGDELFLANCGKLTALYDNEGNFVPVYDSARVFRSSDAGRSWDDVTGSLRTFRISGFGAVAVPQYPDRVFLCVVGDDSVYTSTEGGRQWVALTLEGLPGPITGSPRFWGNPLVADTGSVYLGYRGISRRPWSDATITAVEEIHSGLTPLGYVLGQNYPNPCNPTTTITYSLPRRSQVSLTLFNLLGQKVKDLVNGVADAGAHSVRLDASTLASGMYFYRLQSGSFVSTKKLLFMR